MTEPHTTFLHLTDDELVAEIEHTTLRLSQLRAEFDIRYYRRLTRRANSWGKRQSLTLPTRDTHARPQEPEA